MELKYMMFQSLSGFQVRCNLSNVHDIEGLLLRFNPYRVFRFVATQSNALNDIEIIRFNPYRVFRFVATESPVLQARVGSGFQSLSGFQVRCNPLAVSQMWQRAGFNPYRVFRFVATLPLARNVTFSKVSIPIGFSGSLQPRKLNLIRQKMHWFQSLSGFQVRCNFRASARRQLAKEVSIPIGFSGSLQLGQTLVAKKLFNGFNPYRVFRFVATLPSALDNPVAAEFQSLSGFQVRCNRI